MMEFLKGLFGYSTESKALEPASTDEVRKEFSQYLRNLWDYLLTCKDPSDRVLAMKELKKLGIRYESLDLEEPSHHAEPIYFVPMKAEEFKTYSIDMDNAETLFSVKVHLCSWDHALTEDRYGNEDESEDEFADLYVAHCISAALSASFEDLKMKKHNHEESIYFRNLTDWEEIDHNIAFGRFGDFDFDVYDFWLSETYDSEPFEVWVSKNKPHIMAHFAHDYSFDNNRLLVGEIRIIISLMNVRLLNDSFPDHNVAPVLVFSLSTHKQGRILQAHLEHGGLVIRTNKFYDFSGRPDAHSELFLRYMLSDLQGPTRIPNLPQIEYDFSG